MEARCPAEERSIPSVERPYVTGYVSGVLIPRHSGLTESRSAPWWSAEELSDIRTRFFTGSAFIYRIKALNILHEKRTNVTNVTRHYV